MLMILLILALCGTIILVFHVSLEINGLEKRITALTARIKEHYESTQND